MSKKTPQDYELKSLGRSKVLIKTTLKLGSHKAKNKLTRSFFPEEAISSSAEEKEIAEIIFKGLCQLRGTALKLAQFISSQNGLLKPEHLEVLKQSHYQVPPLNAIVVSKMIRTEFNVEKEELFSDFEDKAFAAASLGQVHKAKLKDGTMVAIKIQYPGIDQTISIDLNLIKKFFKAFPRKEMILNSLNSIESRLCEEVDYTIEKNYAEIFYQIYNSTPIFIPKVYPEFSSQRVITYEYVEGLSIQDWLKTNPDQIHRNLIGQLVWNLLCESIFKHRILHCDPNWGNFLIHNNFRLAVLDFGCVQKLTQESVLLFKELWSPDSEVSTQNIISLYIKLGANIDNSNQESIKKFYEQIILPYKKWLNIITNCKTFHFSQHPGFSIEGQKILFKEVFSTTMSSFSPEFTLIHRTFFGILQILEALGSDVDIHSP